MGASTTKPSEFYVGVIDFFAILLPGAIATAILFPTVIGTHVVGLLAIDPANNPGKWVAFLTCSYFLGHLIFLAGSYIDPSCETRRQRREHLGRERLERRKTANLEELPPEVEDERAYRCATSIRDSMLDNDERAALNTFQWSRSVLIAKCPAAAEDIHRLEADSKFFRSLLVVCALSPIIFFFNWWGLSSRTLEGLSSRALEIGVALLLVPPCFARYYGRRLKSRTQAYIHVVTLHRLGSLSNTTKPTSP